MSRHGRPGTALGDGVGDYLAEGGPLAGLSDPSTGIPTDIRVMGAGVTAQAEVCRGMTGRLDGVEADLAANTSHATTFLAGDAQAIRDRLLTAADSFDHYRRTFDTYALAVDTIAAECSVVCATITAALADIESFATTIRRISGDSLGEWTFRWDRIPSAPGVSNGGGIANGGGALGVTEVNEADAAAIDRARDGWRQCLTTIASARRTWASLVEQRACADRAAIDGFGSLPVFAAAGVTAPGGRGSPLDADYASPFSVWANQPGDVFEGLFSGNEAAALDALASLPVGQVARIWAGLSSAFRRALAARDPERVGTLRGVSAADRDHANVLRLPGLLAAASADYERLATQNGPFSFDGSPDMVAAAAKLAALKLLNREFGERRGRDRNPPRLLISLDASKPGAPLAAVSVGQLDEATDVAYVVPGMNSSVFEYPDYERAASRIRSDEDGRAVVVWLNYLSPGPANVASNACAEAGAERLRRDLSDQERVAQAVGRTQATTVIAHSYGTTLSSLALSKPGVSVDAFVLLGSAGVPNGIRGDDLHVSPGKVFVAQAESDTLASVGQVFESRQNPELPGWGARLFGVDGITLPDGTRLDGVDGHNAVGGSEEDDRRKYFGTSTESLDNILGILEGRDPTPGRPPTHFAEGTNIR